MMLIKNYLKLPLKIQRNQAIIHKLYEYILCMLLKKKEGFEVIAGIRILTTKNVFYRIL